MSSPVIDSSQHPIVIVVFPEEMSLDDVRQFGRQMIAMAEEKGPYHSIADISALKSSTATAKHRAEMSKAVDAIAARGLLLTEVVVAANTVLRGLVAAYAWLRANKNHPFKCVATVDVAIAWVNKMQEAAKERPRATA